MLYSIRYRDMQETNELIEALHARNVMVVLDVRSRPRRGRVGFTKPVLERRLSSEGISYMWSGRTLGGGGTIRESDIRHLARWQEDKTVCLMCRGHDAASCHIDSEIAPRLGKYGVSVQQIVGCDPGR